jgi:hypothetical protein
MTAYDAQHRVKWPSITIIKQARLAKEINNCYAQESFCHNYNYLKLFPILNREKKVSERKRP